jgi:hypothetical protein
MGSTRCAHVTFANADSGSMNTALSVLLLLLCAVACQAPPSALSPSDRPTPTPILVPTSSPGPAGTLCRPSDVTLSPGRLGAGAGTSYIAIQVALVGIDSCRWPKWPATELRDATGPVIARGAAAGPESIRLDSPLGLALGWSSWCLPPPDAPLLLAVLLPDGEVTTTLPIGFGADCMNAPTAINLQVVE